MVIDTFHATGKQVSNCNVVLYFKLNQNKTLNSNFFLRHVPFSASNTLYKKNTLKYFVLDKTWNNLFEN